MKEGKVKN